MRKLVVAVSVLTLILVLVSATGICAAENPWEVEKFWADKFWPSKYGPNDTLGALNLVTPEKTKQALQMIKEYKVYDLGMEYYNGFPAYPPRGWHSVVLFHGMHQFDHLPNHMTYLEEQLTLNLGIGTQIDGLAHVGIGDRFYNGNKLKDFATAKGLKKFGSEKVPVVITRGILVDMAAYKGVEMMKAGEEITVEDIKGALKKQGNLQIKSGDVVLLYTGWSKLLNEKVDAETLQKNRNKFGAGEPGPALPAAKYLTSKGVSMIGADTWALEVLPGRKDAPGPFIVHEYLLTVNGVYILENFELAQLAKDKVYEFCLILTHPKIRGMPQSILQPIAIK